MVQEAREVCDLGCLVKKNKQACNHVSQMEHAAQGLQGLLDQPRLTGWEIVTW